MKLPRYENKITGIYNYGSGEIFGHYGFFSMIRDATIKNLSLSGDIFIQANSGDNGNSGGGGFVQNVFGNCQILNCENRINLSKESNGRDVAGFVGGMNEGSTLVIKNCVNYGNMTGSNNCAGIVGNTFRGKSLTIENCCNKGNITNYLGTFAAGLVAKVDNYSEEVAQNAVTTIKNSYNEGIIRAFKMAGGLVSRAYSNINIDNSYNVGEIYSEQRVGTTKIGGIIGNVEATSPNCIITNSYNLANIYTGSIDYQINAGGLMGETRAENTEIINCYNLGNIENSSYGSGICLVYAPSGTSPIITAKNSYNAGTINGTNKCGFVYIYNAPITLNVDKSYYLSGTASVGIFDRNNSNGIQDTSIALTEDKMKEQNFVNELNKNLNNLNAQYNLRKWKYSANNYPSFE